MHATLLAAGHAGSGISGWDWAVIIVFLVVTTVVAFAKKGRQVGLRDFFLSDRNLPWTVVCVSLIATEISAASFVGVPFHAYKEGGSLTYLQLAIGAILARFMIAHYFIPAFYARETYSPYHHMGQRLGVGAERMTGLLFMIGAILGQGVRVFIIAQVLQIITGFGVLNSIMVIGLFAALWGLVGGIRTVVWTDMIQFVVIVIAVIAAAVYLIVGCDGIGPILRLASESQKLHVLDFRFDLMLEFTIWTGLLGATFNTLASHGADQMNAQRIFCCRGSREAKKAMIWSSLSQVLVLLFLFIGLALYAYPDQDALRADNVESSRVLPLFIATVLPHGLKGLLIIGLMAAAISSLSSALTALAQTTVGSFLINTRRSEFHTEESRLRLARLFVVFWGVMLCATAAFFQNIEAYRDVLNIGFRSTSFIYGALLGALLMAFLPLRRDGRGIVFGAPFAALAAFGMSFPQPWTHWIVIAGVGTLFICWCYALFHEAEQLISIRNQNQFVRRAWYILLAEFPRTIWVLAASAMVLYLHFGEFYRDYLGVEEGGLAWPWYLPLGVGSTVVLSYLLSRPQGFREDAG